MPKAPKPTYTTWKRSREVRLDARWPALLIVRSAGQRKSVHKKQKIQPEISLETGPNSELLSWEDFIGRFGEEKTVLTDDLLKGEWRNSTDQAVHRLLCFSRNIGVIMATRHSVKKGTGTKDPPIREQMEVRTNNNKRFARTSRILTQRSRGWGWLWPRHQICRSFGDNVFVLAKEVHTSHEPYPHPCKGQRVRVIAYQMCSLKKCVATHWMRQKIS